MLKHVVKCRDSRDHLLIQRSCVKSSLNGVNSKNEQLIQTHQESVKDLVNKVMKENKTLKAENVNLSNELQSLKDENRRLEKRHRILHEKNQAMKDFYETVDIYPIIRERLQAIGRQAQEDINNQ